MQKQVNSNKPFLFITPEQAKEKFGVKEVHSTIIGHPVLSKNQISASMVRYRKYVAAYNDSIKNLNKEVLEYNTSVYVAMEQYNLASAHKDNTATLMHLYKHLSISDYNAKVKEFNASTSAPTVLMKKHQKVRQQHQETFLALLYKYAADIKKNNDSRIKLKQRNLETLKVCSTSFSYYNEDGTRRLDISTRSIKNHLYRLRDAGILFNYSYHGPSKAVEYHINGDILVIFDQQKKNTLNTSNQLFTISLVKNFPNNRVDTSTNINKKEIKSTVDNSTATIKGDLQVANHINNFFKRNNLLLAHQPGSIKKEFRPAKNQLSEDLQALILDDDVLAENLKNHLYDDFNSQDALKYLELEARSTGTMLPNDYRHLIIQTALKSFAHCWANKTIWVWDKTIQLFYDEYFKNPNGTIPSKPVLFYKFKNFMLRAKFVFSQVKKGWQCQPPITYFDPTRTTAQEAGFAYTIKVLDKIKKKQAAAEKNKEKRNADAKKRKQNNLVQKFILKEVCKYRDNKINYNQLISNILSNKKIPQSNLKNLGKWIEYAYTIQKK